MASRDDVKAWVDRCGACPYGDEPGMRLHEAWNKVGWTETNRRTSIAEVMVAALGHMEPATEPPAAAPTNECVHAGGCASLASFMEDFVPRD